MINQEIAFGFLKKAYFGRITSNIDKYDLASNRAYRDLCRTIIFPTKPKPNSNKSVIDSFNEMKRGLRISATSVLRTGVVSGLNETIYDKWHKDTCNAIISIYREKGITIAYGQAQKWVNMFMKYLCVLSPEAVSSFCNKLHVPFDNKVIEMAVKMGAFDKPLKTWSNWTEQEYLYYRSNLNKKIAERYPDTSPIIWEFKHWNGEVQE